MAHRVLAFAFSAADKIRKREVASHRVYYFSILTSSRSAMMLDGIGLTRRRINGEGRREGAG